MAASDPADVHTDRMLEAVRTLVRYAASVARLKGALPVEDIEVEEDVARVMARAMNADRAEQLVEIAAHIETEVARHVHQARVGQAARQVAQRLKEARGRPRAKEASERWLAAIVKEVCDEWQLPLERKGAGADLAIARGILGMKRVEDIGRVIGTELFPSESWGERTMSGVVAALGGTEQRQGLFREPRVARGALHTEPLQHDVALWALSVAFPSASSDELLEMTRTAGAILRGPPQEPPSALQSKANEPELSTTCGQDSDEPGGLP